MCPYNSNLEVSLAAINASASIGNEAAIPRLFDIIEKGKPAQKKAAINTLTKIKAPSSIVFIYGADSLKIFNIAYSF